MITTEIKEGDSYTVEERVGYVLIQYRPFDCRIMCKCGNCHGKVTRYPGKVEKVTYFADNSIEIDVKCEDGKIRREMVVAPHGD